jgi:hypothetical protein
MIINHSFGRIVMTDQLNLVTVALNYDCGGCGHHEGYESIEKPEDIEKILLTRRFCRECEHDAGIMNVRIINLKYVYIGGRDDD